MSGAAPDHSRLAGLAGKLGLHEHLCLIYDTQEEQLASAIPYLRAGLERGEKCLYIADENTAGDVLEALRKAGTDVDVYLKSGALAIVDQREVYLKTERFEPDSVIRFWTDAVTQARAAKFSGLRTVVAEMTWALGESVDTRRLIEYECKLNHFVRDHDAVIVCQYNRARFPPEVILGVLRTHPVVVHGDLVSKNPYYVPPEELLKPNQPSLEVERLLKNILEREQAEEELQRSRDHLRALAARLQNAREEERGRLAREIHDELGSALTAIKIDLSSFVHDLPPEKKQEYDPILDEADETIQIVRRISTELRPGILDSLGPVAAIEWAAEEFEARTGTKCRLNLPQETVAIDPERATALFRIFQETLTNVARHANATELDVRLARDNGNLLLEVHDNGEGINEEQISNGTSLGILGMRERALLLGGELTISGERGKGTTVRVRIPQSHPPHPEKRR